MAKNKKKLKNGKKAGKAAGAEQAPETLRPADCELRFQHVLRNMVVAREKAKAAGS